MRVIESTFEVGRRFRCTMPIDRGQLDPGAVIRPEPGEWRACASASTSRSWRTGAPAATRSISSRPWPSAVLLLPKEKDWPAGAAPSAAPYWAAAAAR
jgi:hypothetical protein